MDDELAGGAALDEVAKKYNLDVVKVGPIRRDGSTPDKKDGMKDFVKDSSTILNAAFGMGNGETSPVLALSGGRYAAIRMETIAQKSYQPFDQVKEDLSKQWIADQQNVLNKDRARDALQKLQGNGATFSSLAQSLGGEVKKLDLTRMEKAPEPLNNAARAAFFEAAKGEYSIQPVQGGLLIGRVTEISLPDSSKAPADQLKTIREASLQSMGDEILQAYLDSLRARYKVTVNDALVKSMYDKTDNAATEDNDPNADQ
jgi:peptidyl-prolyl cis-trans isomerase D